MTILTVDTPQKTTRPSTPLVITRELDNSAEGTGCFRESHNLDDLKNTCKNRKTQALARYS